MARLSRGETVEAQAETFMSSKWDADAGKAACFSGYRPDKFSFPLDESSMEYACLRSVINVSVARAMESGYNVFLCGMAKGFDIMCGEAVAAIKARDIRRADVALVAVVPYAGHGRWKGEWTRRHDALIDVADDVVVMCERYTRTCYHERNRFMVDNSTRLICYWDGQEGGTANTIRYAYMKNIEVVNLASEELTTLLPL